jgi:septal ring factor EnvC (AmiA/AmiB activator)
MISACASLFLAPVNGVVVRGFEPPACTYCAGHRGVSVAVQEGAPVRAIASGTISFAGEVAGNLFVVLQFAPDLRLTYGYLRDTITQEGDEIARGDVVAVGDVLGHSRNRVYLGVRRGHAPVDPRPFVGAKRARLVSVRDLACGISRRSR